MSRPEAHQRDDKGKGPTQSSIHKAAQEQAASHLKILAEAEALRAEQEASRPDKLLARIAYLERSVKSLSSKVSKLTKELKK